MQFVSGQMMPSAFITFVFFWLLFLLIFLLTIFLFQYLFIFLLHRLNLITTFELMSSYSKLDCIQIELFCLCFHQVTKMFKPAVRMFFLELFNVDFKTLRILHKLMNNITMVVFIFAVLMHIFIRLV